MSRETILPKYKIKSMNTGAEKKEKVTGKNVLSDSALQITGGINS